MEEKIVTSQAELDAIPDDYEGKIIIKFGTPSNHAVVNRRFKYPVVAHDDASVTAYGSASVTARDDASVTACDFASVTAYGSASVTAHDDASVTACDDASVTAYGSASVAAHDSASVVALNSASVAAFDYASVAARGSASVTARGSASVAAFGSASVAARDDASVTAFDFASVTAHDDASVTATGYAQILDVSYAHNIELKCNARVVYLPQNIDDYMSYYGIDDSTETVKLYKAVHKYSDGTYHADYNRDFVYTIGAIAEVDDFNGDTHDSCGAGINMAYLDWALRYGRAWGDLAILELEAEKDDVLVPANCDGKVRAPKAKVIREVPLEECGIYGKILARRHKHD